MCNSKRIGTIYICPICGNDFKQSSKGRTKKYCSSNCKNLVKYLNAFENCLSNVSFVGKYSNIMKGDIFRLANTIKCT